MEQKINKPGKLLDSNTIQKTDSFQNNDALTKSVVQDAETNDDEIIEKKDTTDYWSLPQKDNKTINQNIKMRNR
jgi:hypothetical protein